MMNIEHFKEDLIKYLFESSGDGFAIVKGKIRSCGSTDCSICDFGTNNNPSGNLCEVERIECLTKEYIPNPTLTKRQYYFLKSLPFDSKLRNDNVNKKVNIQITLPSCQLKVLVLEYDIFDILFHTLPLESGRWYHVSHLLKWEVKDEEQ